MAINPENLNQSFPSDEPKVDKNVDDGNAMPPWLLVALVITCSAWIFFLFQTLLLFYEFCEDIYFYNGFNASTWEEYFLVNVVFSAISFLISLLSTIYAKKFANAAKSQNWQEIFYNQTKQRKKFPFILILLVLFDIFASASTLAMIFIISIVILYQSVDVHQKYSITVEHTWVSVKKALPVGIVLLKLLMTLYFFSILVMEIKSFLWFLTRNDFEWRMYTLPIVYVQLALLFIIYFGYIRRVFIPRIKNDDWDGLNDKGFNVGKSFRMKWDIIVVICLFFGPYWLAWTMMWMVYAIHTFNPLKLQPAEAL